MSDQSERLIPASQIDGSNLINTPPGPPGPPGAGITSINADAALAQFITAGTGIQVADLGGGVHRISNTGGGGGGGGGLTSINGDVTPAQAITPVAPMVFTNPGAGAHSLSVTTFAGVGTTGVVPNPGGASGNRTLKSDGSWFVPHNHSSIPGAQNIPDATPTQIATLTVPVGEHGDYFVEASVAFAFNGTGARTLVIKLGGVIVRSVNAPAINNVAATGNVLYCARLLPQIPAGTIISMEVAQDSGGPLAIVTGIESTSLLTYRINN